VVTWSKRVSTPYFLWCMASYTGWLYTSPWNKSVDSLICLTSCILRKFLTTILRYPLYIPQCLRCRKRTVTPRRGTISRPLTGRRLTMTPMRMNVSLSLSMSLSFSRRGAKHTSQSIPPFGYVLIQSCSAWRLS